jgi:hypothetical protein
MGKMKDLVTDDWDRAYAEGYRKGYATALRWGFEAAFYASQNQQQTSEKQGRPSASSAPTHDPLCPIQSPQRWDRYPWSCCCDLITKVRQDERTKLIEHINLGQEKP